MNINGAGNAKIVGFSGNREAKINLESATFDNEAIAMMTGNGLVTGAADVYKREILTVNSDGATLSKTPVGGELISLYTLNADGSHKDAYTKDTTTGVKKYTLTTKTLAFADNEIADGEQIVAYYKISTGTTGKKITISSDKFAGSFKLVLDCLVRDIYTKADFAAQLIIHNCKMEDNWGFSLSADGDPSTFTMPIEVLKPSSGTEMITMMIYDEGAAS